MLLKDERNLGSGRQESYIFKVDEIQSYGRQHFSATVMFFTGNAFTVTSECKNDKNKERYHEVLSP
jgi:hypothetical protein